MMSQDFTGFRLSLSISWLCFLCTGPIITQAPMASSSSRLTSLQIQRKLGSYLIILI